MTPEIAAVRALARTSRLLERSSPELPLAHYRVLAAIASGDARASHVAARLAVGKPAISAAVEALCQRALIVRETARDDQRATALSLTKEGRDVLTRMEKAMTARLHEVCGRTPDPAQVLQSLSWLGVAMDELWLEKHA